MKRSELIQILMSMPGDDPEVIITVTDHTDYTYKNDISEDNIEMGGPLDDNGYHAVTGEQGFDNDTYFDENQEQIENCILIKTSC